MKGQMDVDSHEEYLAALEEPRRSELTAIDALIREVLPEIDRFMMSGIMGYGKYRYKYASGRSGDWCRIGLASNKNYISLYCCASDERGYVGDRYRERLPKAKIGKSCVTFKRLSDLDLDVVRELIRESFEISLELEAKMAARGA